MGIMDDSIYIKLEILSMNKPGKFFHNFFNLHKKRRLPN